MYYQLNHDERPSNNKDEQRLAYVILTEGNTTLTKGEDKEALKDKFVRAYYDLLPDELIE